MPLIADRVKETSTTTGTGTLNLGGALSGFRTFVAGIGSGNQCYYCISHRNANEWEVGLGTVTSGSPDTLARNVVLSSSNAGALTSFSAGTKDVFVAVPSSTLWTGTVKVIEPVPLQQVAGTVVSKAGTITGPAGVGSSLFLRRVTIDAVMNLSEIQAAMSIAFPATNQGAGTMSRRFGLYSFGNSTSLASVLSASSTSAWNTGTITAGASTSLTQFQGGWSTPLIQPMTFASSSIAPGEYVVAQLFDFAQGSSTWTLNLYGAIAASTFLASAATNLTSATLGALSSGGLAAASAHTATTGSAMTMFSAAPSNVIVGKVASTAGFSAAAASSVMATATANSTLSLLLNTGTGAFGPLSSGGLSAGSFIGTSGSLSAVTNVALGALNSSTIAQLTLPIFGFIGTNSTTSGVPTQFQMGIMSTGGLPTAITLTSAAVTISGSIAAQQPWFLMAGA